MCSIAILAIVLTAWLAANMNRKGKADLAARLQPLADLLEGELHAEEVTVTGRWQGQIAEGRMANALDGPGRVFFTRVIDSAGGVSWTWTTSAPKNPAEPREIKFECKDSELCERIGREIEQRAAPFFSIPGWTRVEYDVSAGHIRLTKPMLSRNDIPDVDVFRTSLDTLVSIGAWNRSIIEGASTTTD
jgi:hypothetical protein